MQSKLTLREKQVLKLIVQEYSSLEIAEKLAISIRTVETHRKNIYKKTEVKTLVGLVKYALKQGILN